MNIVERTWGNITNVRKQQRLSKVLERKEINNG